MDDIKKYYLYRALMKRFALPVIVFHMSQIGLTVEQIAQIGAIGYGSQLLLEFPSGALADKIGYKKTLAIAGALNFSGLAVFLGNSYEWFLISAILYWSGAAFRSGADSALFYERLLFLKREKEHRKILGNSRSIAGFVAMVFALLSGAAYQIHWSIPFIISAVMALVYSALILTIGETNHSPNKTTSLAKNMQQAVSFIVALRPLLIVVLFNSIVLGLVLSVNEFNSGLLEQSGFLAGTVGIIYAARHATMIIAGQIGGRIDKFVRPASLLGLLGISFGVLFVGYYVFEGQLATALILILVALPQTILNISYGDYVSKLSSSDVRASIGSAGALATSLVLTLALFMIGISNTSIQLRATLALIGGVVIIVTMILSITLGLTKDKRTLES